MESTTFGCVLQVSEKDSYLEWRMGRRRVQGGSLFLRGFVFHVHGWFIGGSWCLGYDGNAWKGIGFAFDQA